MGIEPALLGHKLDIIPRPWSHWVCSGTLGVSRAISRLQLSNLRTGVVRLRVGTVKILKREYCTRVKILNSFSCRCGDFFGRPRGAGFRPTSVPVYYPCKGVLRSYIRNAVHRVHVLLQQHASCTQSRCGGACPRAMHQGPRTTSASSLRACPPCCSAPSSLSLPLTGHSHALHAGGWLASTASSVAWAIR